MDKQFIKFLRNNLFLIWAILTALLIIFDWKAGRVTWLINIVLVLITCYIIYKIDNYLKILKVIINDLIEGKESIKNDKKLDYVFENQDLNDVYNKEFLKEKNRLERDSNGRYTCDIGDYIDKEFIDSTVNKSLLNICPGLMTGLGILGTFLGLTFALQNFNTGSVNDILKSIALLMDGIKIAFHTSIYGMLFSLLFNWIFKDIFDEAYRVLDDFLSEYDSLVGNSERNNQKNFLIAIEKLSDPIVDKFDSVGKNIESKLDYIGTKIGSELNTILKPSLDSMNQTLENLSNNFNKNQIDSLSNIVKDFVKEMNDSLGSNFDELGNKIKDILLFQNENNNAILGMLEKFRTTTENIEKVNNASVETIKVFSEYIDKVESAHKNIIENVQPIVNQLEQQNKNNIELQNQIKELIKYGDNISIASKDFSNKISDNVKVFSELNISIQESIKNITEQSESYTKNINKISSDIAEEYRKQFIELNKVNQESIKIITEQSESYTQNINKVSSEFVEEYRKQFNEISLKAKELLNSVIEIDENNRKKEIQLLTNSSIELLNNATTKFQNMIDNAEELSKTYSNDMERAAKEISKLSLVLNENLSESLKNCFNVFDENLSKISSHLSGTIMSIDKTIERVPKIISASCEDLEKSFKDVKNIIIMAKNLKTIDSQRIIGYSDNFVQDKVETIDQSLKSVNLSK